MLTTFGKAEKISSAKTKSIPIELAKTTLMEIDNKQTLGKMEIGTMTREETGIMILGKNMYQETITEVNIMKVIVFLTGIRETSLRITLETIGNQEILKGAIKRATSQ